MKRIVRLRVDPEKSALDITPTYDCPFYYSVLMAITEVKKKYPSVPTHYVVDRKFQTNQGIL